MASIELLLSSFYQFVADEVYPHVVELLTEPFKNEYAIWLVAPLITVLVFMSIYFGKHREEELGWNTAFGNSISLIFVCTALLRFLYEHYELASFLTLKSAQYRLIITAIIFIQALSLLFLDFFHTIPKRVAFFFSSPVFINTTAFLGIVLVYSSISINWVTISAAGTIYLLVFIFSFTLAHLITPSKEAKAYLQRLKEEKAEQDRIKKIARTREIHEIEHRWITAWRHFKLNVKVFLDKLVGR